MILSVNYRLNWWRLLSNPAEHHENTKLELPGLGNPQEIRDLGRVVRDKLPSIMFLMETKASNAIFENVRNRLGFHCCFTVTSIGRSGGMALLWKEDIPLEVINFLTQHIHARVREMGCEENFFITGFYGSPVTSQ